MSVLEDLRDYLKARVAAYDAAKAQDQAKLDAVEAELVRVPTIDDMRALLTRVPTA